MVRGVVQEGCGPRCKDLMNRVICCAIQTDLNYPDTPKAAAWVGDSLIICIKKELYHTTVSHRLELGNYQYTDMLGIVY